MANKQREICKSRDNAVLKDIEEWGCMNLKMIKTLHFSNISSANNCDYRKAHERCSKMLKKGKLKRWRDIEGDVYTLDMRKGRSEHKLAVNWVRLWFTKRLGESEVLRWQYEDDYTILRSDGFATIENKQWKTFKFFFVEMDCNDRSHNAFDKTQKYNELYEKELYSERFWAKHITGNTSTDIFDSIKKKMLPEQFPLIYIVTMSEGRRKSILKLIEEENRNNLRFKVILLEELKKEVLG